MKSDHFQHRHRDGSLHHVYRWLPDGPVTALLQIVHGMAEHAGRYRALAEDLTARGVAVYAQDLPGHGRTGEAAGTLGHFADRDGWNHALDCIAGVRAEARNAHPGVPVFVLGHSMGSFLGQYLLGRGGDDLRGVILSATTRDMGPMRGVGALLMRVLAALRGSATPSALGEALSFKAFNKAFAPNRTAFDWLSRDAAEVDAYVADPHCGHQCSLGLWRDLLDAGADLGSPAMLDQVPADTAVLLLAGSADPVSQGEAGPRALAAAYRDAGVSQVDEAYWSDARHELLHETCRDEVISTLGDWVVNLSGAGRS